MPAVPTGAKTGKKTTPPADWRVAVLKGIGAPVTAVNLGFLSLWQRFEGGPADNPLNTSLNTSHVTGVVNSSGVKRYDSQAAGVDATVKTLLNTKGVGYDAILSLLRKGNADPAQLAEAVTNSSWDAGHYHATKTGIISKVTGRPIYTGGSLVTATLGKLPAGSGNPWAGVPGDVAHYTAHPGAGFDKTKTATKDAVQKPINNAVKEAGMYVLYGAAILGGGLVVITGFVLVAADIGIAGRATRAVGKSPLGTAVSYASTKTPRARRAAYAAKQPTSREGTPRTRKVKVTAVGPAGTKRDRAMVGKTRTVRVKKEDEIPF